MKPYQTDQFDEPIFQSYEPDTGLSGNQEPISIPAQGCGVVGCSEFECGLPSDGEEAYEVPQPTTYNSDEVEIEEGKDLNDIDPDPDALPPFPIDELPSIIQELATTGASVFNIPIEFYGLYSLGAICAALKKKVVLKDKYTNYSQLWLATVARSGVGKTPPLYMCFAPLNKRDKDASAKYKQDFRQWQIDCSAAKKSKKPEPPKPTQRQYLIGDTSPESLYGVIESNDGVTQYRDELSSWFGDFGRYNQSGEIGQLLSIFNNDTIRVTRKTSEPIFIEKAYLSVVGSIQPSELNSYLKSKGLTDNGFVQRFLFCYLDDVQRGEYSEDVMPEELLDRYDEFIGKLCDLNYTHQDPMIIKYSAEAKRVYVAFVNEMTRRINASENDYLRALYSKMEIFLCRLSLPVYVGKLVAGEGESEEIDAQTMEYCVRLCRYFIATGEKVYRLISEPQRKQTIGNEELIKQLYERYNIKSQTKLAEALGVRQQAISKFLKK